MWFSVITHRLPVRKGKSAIPSGLVAGAACLLEGFGGQSSCHETQLAHTSTVRKTPPRISTPCHSAVSPRHELFTIVCQKQLTIDPMPPSPSTRNGVSASGRERPSRSAKRGLATYVPSREADDSRTQSQRPCRHLTWLHQR